MKNVHICLISGQTLPNLIPILMHKPEMVHLIITTDMTEKAEHLIHILKQQNITYSLFNKAPSANLTQLTKYARQLVVRLKQRYDDDDDDVQLSFNCTGGTKLMVLAFVKVFEAEWSNVQLFYTDTKHNVLEYLQPLDKLETMSSVLNVSNYLAAQGFSIEHAESQEASWRTRARKRKALSYWLAQHAWQLSDFLNELKKLSNQAWNQQQVRQRFSKTPHGIAKEALHQLLQHHVIQYNGGQDVLFPEIANNNADKMRYLNGFWLEEYTWLIAQEISLDDVESGVKVDWLSQKPNQSLKNEFDMLAVYHNRLLVIECKTALTSKQDIITKLDSLGRKVGGLFGHTLLCSAYSLDDAIKTRAMLQKVDIIDGKQLSQLREKMTAWMDLDS
ncbi:MAG: DUF1887 family protein [Thiomargarita sp.]|nr:DUF1887 family protein [Thiomargarita sp.]